MTLSKTGLVITQISLKNDYAYVNKKYRHQWKKNGQ